MFNNDINDIVKNQSTGVGVGIGEKVLTPTPEGI